MWAINVGFVGSITTHIARHLMSLCDLHNSALGQGARGQAGADPSPLRASQVVLDAVFKVLAGVDQISEAARAGDLVPLFIGAAVAERCEGLEEGVGCGVGVHGLVFWWGAVCSPDVIILTRPLRLRGEVM